MWKKLQSAGQSPVAIEGRVWQCQPGGSQKFPFKQACLKFGRELVFSRLKVCSRKKKSEQGQRAKLRKTQLYSPVSFSSTWRASTASAYILFGRPRCCAAWCISLQMSSRKNEVNVEHEKLAYHRLGCKNRSISMLWRNNNGQGIPSRKGIKTHRRGSIIPDLSIRAEKWARQMLSRGFVVWQTSTTS